MKYLRVEIVNTDTKPEMEITRDERTLYDVMNLGINSGSIETFSPSLIMDPVSAMEYFPTMHEIRNLITHKADYKKDNRPLHSNKLMRTLIKLLCCMEEEQLSEIVFNYKKENERW